MSRLERALLCAASAIALGHAPAAAQVVGHPIEISGGAGYLSADVRANLKDAPAYAGAVGWRAMPWLAIEGTAVFSTSEAVVATSPTPSRSFFQAGVDLRWHLRPAEGPAVPYVLAGLGYGRSFTEGDPKETLERGSGSFGLGLLLNVRNPRTYVRLQARDQLFQEREQSELSSHIALTAGLQYAFGGTAHDQDRDGVRDWLDQCPNTPIGAKVDAHGCPIDSDGDGVYDGIDKCEGTPKGCKVDKDGCPTDADGDGVCDGLDQCDGTPAGAKVDAHGCPIDSDGDGVFDGLDPCDGTPKGCTIDARGCPADADSDGVCDGLDQCPNTPHGLRVDPNGCPVEVSEKEVQLLDTGTIRLGNIQFDTGKATLKPESYAVLDTVALILQQYPTLKIEIGGHTDNVGTAKKNQQLSEDRARAVQDYLRTRIVGFDSTSYSARGYGLSQPIAPNTTALGRSKNRRVEFKVMNTEALRIEREKRRFLRKEEGAPPSPTPAPPDTTKR